ncbi:MAG TPA: GAF domain-containing protein [Pseudonocardiaceae bacterium]|jgi:GAF domain-containing protein|nr:GAF domain-containing protein [Pseudonocardiaceae bacterium]
MAQSLDSTALVAAVTGAMTDPGQDDRELLTSIVRVARSIFGAAASSIFLFDSDAAELVFEAVSGEGEDFLVGTHFPADQGIAGWVVATGEPMTVDGLTDNPLFARDLAESTGYVPDSIMAVPVVHQTDILGVLQVLDPHPQSRSSIADLDLLMMFAHQAGLSLHGLTRSRAAHAAFATAGAEFDRLVSVVRTLAALGPEQRASGLRLVDSLQELLAGLVGDRDSRR